MTHEKLYLHTAAHSRGQRVCTFFFPASDPLNCSTALHSEPSDSLFAQETFGFHIKDENETKIRFSAFISRCFQLDLTQFSLG